MRVTILHTNDLHGRIDALARIATLVERIRAESPHPVLYVDAGDAEEASVRLSSLTKGAAMHRLLSAAGCSVAAVGNAAWLRYGTHVLADHAAAASYPLLLANLRPVEGAVPAAVVGGVGFVGVTDPFRQFLDGFHDGLEAHDEVETVLRHARELRRVGARLVVCVSHLGLEPPPGRTDPPVVDPVLAERVAGEVDLIVGAHTHHVLPHGERIGDVLIAQAGAFGEQLGRIEVDGGWRTASLLPVPDDIPRHPAVLAEVERVEGEIGVRLAEVVGVLEEPLDCLRVAAILRDRMGAEIGLAAEGATLAAPLAAGPLRRGALWEACESTGNPGVTTMKGEQLRAVVERAAEPRFMADRPRTLRGRRRGRLFVAGPGGVDPGREYLVAGTDWELEPYGGLVDAGWKLEVRYDFPTILREAVEEALRKEERC